MGGALGVAAFGAGFFGYVGPHSFRAAFIHTAPVIAIVFLVSAALTIVLPKTAVAGEAEPDSQPTAPNGPSR